MFAGQMERVARQSGLLAQHCVLRSGCMREGDNMLASLVTEFPFHPPGVPSNSQAGTISLLNPPRYGSDILHTMRGDGAARCGPR